MKVSSVGFSNPYRAQVKNLYLGDVKNQNKNEFSKSDLDESRNVLSAYPIHFAGFAKNPIPIELTALKGRGLPCFYCGKKMISKALFDHMEWVSTPREKTLESFIKSLSCAKEEWSPREKEIIRKLKEVYAKNPDVKIYKALFNASGNFSEKIEKYRFKSLTPREYSTEMLKLVKKHEPMLTDTKKAVFQEMELYHRKHPEASLIQIVQALRPKHLGALVRKQEKVFERIDNQVSNLPKEIRSEVRAVTDKARAIVRNEKDDNPFKRRMFIDRMREVIKSIDDPRVIKNIERELQTLPFSSNSVDAFIVKYSSPVKYIANTKNWEELINEQYAPAYQKLKQSIIQAGQEFDFEKYISANSAKHKESLVESRNFMVQELRNQINEYTLGFESLILKVLSNAKKQVSNPEIDSSQQRLNLLNDLRKLKPIVHANYLASIISTAEKMPYCKNDMDAFLLKRKPYIVPIDEKQTENIAGKKVKYKVESFIKKDEQEIYSEVLERHEAMNSGLDLPDYITANEEELKKIVTAKQNAVLKEVEKLVKDISNNYKMKVEENLVDLHSPSISHSMWNINEIPYLDSRRAPQILKVTKAIDNSKFDVDAMVCNYAEARVDKSNKQVQKIYRSDREIAQNLIIDSIETVEHLKPKSTWVDPSNGQNDIGNLVYAHSVCNAERENMPQSQYFKLHPSFLKQNNPQKQMDEIIRGINAGEIKGLDDYPQKIRNTELLQSKNPNTGEPLVNLDISALDLNQAKINREKLKIKQKNKKTSSKKQEVQSAPNTVVTPAIKPVRVEPRKAFNPLDLTQKSDKKILQRILGVKQVNNVKKN